MQSVSLRTYTIFNLIHGTAGWVIFILSCLALFVPQYQMLGERFGFNVVSLFFSLLLGVYGTIIYHFQKNKNPWVASFVSSCLAGLTFVNLMHNTGDLASWWNIGWMLAFFYSGIFGAFVPMGCAFLTTFYFALIATTEDGGFDVDWRYLVVAAANFAACYAGYRFFKRYAINQENQDMARLSGQLRNKQQQAEILIETISDGIILIDAEGKIGLMNKAAATMTGWPVGEGTGIDVHLVVKLAKEDGKELEPGEEPFVEAISKQQPVSRILQLKGRNEVSPIVSIVVTPVMKNETMIGAVAVLRDISAERAEEHRRADFISTASHEMRTPVAAIEGYLALALNEKVSRIDAKARDFLEKAHASTQHLGKLFQDLLTSAKAEDGRLVSHPVVVELGAYMDQLVDSLRFAADKKGLLMDLTLGTSGSETDTVGGSKVIRPLYYVHADPDRLREVITNIFDNAVKYTPNGKISVGLTGNNEVIQLFVKDTGPGIPAEDVPHLFQKFYRVDNSSTRTVGGTGLGLFICKKIIELYRGRIWAESEVGKGSTFYINLPRLSSDKAAELQKLEAQNQGVAPVTSLTTPVV